MAFHLLWRGQPATRRKQEHGGLAVPDHMNKTAQVLLVIWLMIAAFVGYLVTGLVSSRLSEEQRIHDQAISYVRLVEQHAAAAFERAYIGLMGVEDHLRSTDLIRAGRLPDDRRKQIEELLIAQQQRVAGVISMSVSDADGNVFANSVATASSLYLGDREYFLTLKQQPRNTPVISEAVFGRGTKKWGIHVVRRIDFPDGSFGGMVGASLGLTENFAEFYATLALGKNSTVSLRDAENRLLVRYPVIDEIVGKQVAAGGPIYEHFSAGDPEGVAITRSSIDNIERVFAFHRLPNYPIYAVVGLSLEDALSGWRRERDNVAIGVLLAILAGTFITIVLLQKEGTETELTRESYRNQLLLRIASDGIHVLDAEGNVQEASDAFCSMLGYTRAELLGMNVAQWDARWSSEEVKQMVRRMQQLKTAPTVFETKHRRRDRCVIDVEISSIGVELDGKPALFCSARDITERKRADQVLKDSEQRLNLASAAGEVGVWDLDLISDQAWRSLRHDQIFGYDSVQPSWDHKIFMSHVIPEDREIVQRRFEGAYDSGHLLMECRILRKDQSLRWIAVNGQVFRDEHGKPVRMMGVITDITEHRQMEAEIRALNENLEHRVVERTAELEKSHQELQALTAIQESFQEEERKRIARELHDELAQKLTVLKLQIASLMQVIPSEEPGLTQQLQDMNSLLTETIHAVGQIAANLRPVVLDELGLVTALRDLTEEFSARTKVDCEFSVHPADLSVDNGLATPLYRMVQESLTNVARHAQATEVIVSLYRDPSGKIILDINDNGKGFTNVDQSMRKSFGLIGMRERTAMLGGEMKIRSQPGAGTSIEFVIPQNPSRPQASA